MPAAGKFLALTFLVSMMPSVSALQLDCGPGAEAEEKTQHTLTCEGLQADGTVYWTKYDRNLGKITVATCDATGSCQTNFSTRYDVKRPNNVTSTLKILEVKRDETFVEGEWSCVSRSNETASCYVTVVFLPHVGECTMGFSEQSGQVAGRCEMHKVYPSPTCNWYEELEGQETDIPSNQTTLSLTQYVDSSTSQIYFRGECMLHRPLPVTAGSYSYKVLIIPGLVEPLVDFTTTNRVAVPAPPVLRNCPQDYVTDADANSCTCATSDLGSPQGSLAWYDPNNSTVLRNTSLILALPFSRVTAEFSEQTYRCGVVHHTGTPSVDYVPKIAASPNKPKLSGYDKNKEYKVGETITLQCSVDGGRPVITQLILECAERPDEADSHVGDSVISRLSFTLMEADNNGECQCYATNKFLTSERVTQRLHVTPTGGDKEDYLAIGVGAGVGAAVLIGVVIALVVLFKRRKTLRENDDDERKELKKNEGGSIRSNGSSQSNDQYSRSSNSADDHTYATIGISVSETAPQLHQASSLPTSLANREKTANQDITASKIQTKDVSPPAAKAGNDSGHEGRRSPPFVDVANSQPKNASPVRKTAQDSDAETSSPDSTSDTEKQDKRALEGKPGQPQQESTACNSPIGAVKTSKSISMSQPSSCSSSPEQGSGEQPKEEEGKPQNLAPGESQTAANGSRLNEEASRQRTSTGNEQGMLTEVTQKTSESQETQGNNISPTQPAQITTPASKRTRVHDGPSGPKPEEPGNGDNFPSKPAAKDDTSLEPHPQQQADQQNSGKAPADLSTAGNDSSQEERQRGNTETNKVSHTAKTCFDPDKTVHNDEERESRSSAGTRADVNAGDKTSTEDAPAINMPDPNLIKQEQPKTEGNQDTLTPSTEEPNKQRHNANIELEVQHDDSHFDTKF